MHVKRAWCTQTGFFCRLIECQEESNSEYDIERQLYTLMRMGNDRDFERNLPIITSEPSTRADAYRVQLYCLFLNISHAVHIYLEQLKCIAKSVVYYNYFCKKCVKKLT